MTIALAPPQNNADVVSTALQLLFMGDGSHDDQWGELLNANLYKIEQAIGGLSSIDLSQVAVGATRALTADEQRPGILLFTGALQGPVTITVAAVPRRWLVLNQTTGAFAIVFEADGGTGVVLPQAGSVNAYCDGTDVNVPSVDTVPIGTLSDWAGVELPAGGKYAWANGQAISRSAYPACLTALTRSTTATIGNGQTTIPCAEDLTARNILGAAIEGTGIPANTVVVGATANSLTLSNATTGAAVARTVTIFPWGNGDGASTFNLPDRRERASVAPSTMGGAAASGAGTNAANIGQKLGEASHTLSLAEMPLHSHTVFDNGHTHGVSEVAHSHQTNYATFNTAVATPNSGGTSALSYASSPTALATTATKTGVMVLGSNTGIALGDAGSGAAHNNMQPTMVCNSVVRVL